ncbi:MAG: anion transporter [Chloroflexi bacterium]|nr:anion transporter [Chloroflexota bacterium]
MALAAALLVITYIGIAFTRLPGAALDRPSAAFTGAVLMVLLGVLTVDQAVAAIDFNTISLLLGMMILVAVLRHNGFFHLLADRASRLARTPWRFLVVEVAATAVLSAFLVNDVVVLLFTPVILQVCRRMNVNPVPYLIAEAMASNTGSTATIVGNPQNMLIGVRSGIPFGQFFLYLAPVAVAATGALIAVIYLFYRRHFAAAAAQARPEVVAEAYHPRSMRWSVAILGATMVMFFLSSAIHLQIPVIALASGAAVLLFGRVRPSETIRTVDWVLLLFFAGLFVVVGGARQAGVLDPFLERVLIEPDLKGLGSLLAFSAAGSQVVSNVPLVMLVIPVMEAVPGDFLWVTLAAGSTLGGNLTLIGAVANIIVIESAARRGVHVGFMEFLKVGVVVTLVTLALAALILGTEYRLGVLR